jgi:hypothetical protein
MNKCKGCQWYGKPYWSIINPCENCFRENTNKEREIAEVKIIVSKEVYDEYKGTLQEQLEEKDKEIERLKYIGHKMHLWIFLNSGDEQKVYDELGLTDEENAILGYSGQYKVGDKDDAINRD